MKKSKKYDLAITLIQNQVQLFWLVFSAFLISETVILSSIASLIKDDGNKMIVFFLSIFGLIICVGWWSSFQYNHAFYILRIEEAKKLEKRNGFFKNGQILINNREIYIDDKKVAIPWHGGAPKKAIQILIFIFATAFVALSLMYCPI